MVRGKLVDATNLLSIRRDSSEGVNVSTRPPTPWPTIQHAPQLVADKLGHEHGKDVHGHALQPAPHSWQAGAVKEMFCTFHTPKAKVCKCVPAASMAFNQTLDLAWAPARDDALC